MCLLHGALGCMLFAVSPPQAMLLCTCILPGMAIEALLRQLLLHMHVCMHQCLGWSAIPGGIRQVQQCTGVANIGGVCSGTADELGQVVMYKSVCMHTVEVLLH
eukprot:GHRR01016423.1.p2 GENE.GHRR01016423.1~~GHRR01016423.1.p2  ORF type:complete len:104 (-),score=23.96 GHRR01016423.1:808-1119(-)